MHIKNDDLIDIEFGRWILNKRQKLKFSVFQVSEVTGITFSRLNSIENGLSTRGITEREIVLLAEIYDIKVEVIKNKALGLL